MGVPLLNNPILIFAFLRHAGPPGSYAGGGGLWRDFGDFERGRNTSFERDCKI